MKINNVKHFLYKIWFIRYLLFDALYSLPSWFWSGPGDLCCLCNPIEFPLEFSGMRWWGARRDVIGHVHANVVSIADITFSCHTCCFLFSASLFSFYTTFNSKFLKTVISFVVSLYSLLRFPFLASSLFSLTLTFNRLKCSAVNLTVCLSLSIYIWTTKPVLYLYIVWKLK